MKSQNHSVSLQRENQSESDFNAAYYHLKDTCLHNMLLISMGVGFITFLLFAIASFQVDISRIMVPAIVLISLFIITLYRDLQFSIRAGVFLAQIFILGAAALFSNGFQIPGMLLLLTSAVTSYSLFDGRFGLISSIISFCTVLMFFLVPAENLGSVSSTLLAQKPFIFWTISVFIFSLCLFLIGYPSFYLFGKMDHEYKNQLALLGNLSNANEELQKQTLDFQKRASGLEAVQRINRQISLSQSLETLSTHQMKMIAEHFDLLNCHLSLWNAEQETFDNQFELIRDNMFDTFLEVLTRLEIRTIHKSHDNIEFFQNNRFPEAQSQLLIPVFFQSKPFGILHLLSDQKSTFSLDKLQQLQMISGQIADTIQTIRTKQTLENKIFHLENRQKSQTQASWNEHLRSTHKRFGYQFDGNIINESEKISSNARQAVSKGQVVQTKMYDLDNPDRKFAIASVPIKLRDQVIGVLDFKFDSPEISPETIKVLEAATERLSAALENARLLENIQSRADRERIVAAISDKVRSQNDIDNLLQTAAAEIGRSLGVSEVFVQLDQHN
jgi:GAF domain-containing protein